MSIIYLDTETTGLDPRKHHVWEIAWAREEGMVWDGVIPHSHATADPAAAAINGYEDRAFTGEDLMSMQWTERWAFEALKGATLCAANPAFDAAFLSARWGEAPWKYRLFDIEAYAMGALGHGVPAGIKSITDDLRDRGFGIPEPDHTAKGDVATLRACHLALRSMYEAMRGTA